MAGSIFTDAELDGIIGDWRKLLRCLVECHEFSPKYARYIVEQFASSVLNDMEDTELEQQDQPHQDQQENG